jgi:hypothetical protein
MRPAQVLVHTDLHKLFSGVHFLGLRCTEATMRARIARRRGVPAVRDLSTFLSINDEFSARTVPNMTVIDAERPIEEVEADVRQRIGKLLDHSATLTSRPLGDVSGPADRLAIRTFSVSPVERPGYAAARGMTVGPLRWCSCARDACSGSRYPGVPRSYAPSREGWALGLTVRLHMMAL